jgi:hypothetical protein
MMDRRFFLKLTGFVAAASAFGALPAAAQVQTEAVPAVPNDLQAPGTYQFTGRVRLQQPLVEISGITNAQQISWAGVGGGAAPVAGFTSFEYFDRPWRMPEVQVRGGRLESLAVVPVELG